MNHLEEIKNPWRDELKRGQQKMQPGFVFRQKKIECGVEGQNKVGNKVARAFRLRT